MDTLQFPLRYDDMERTIEDYFPPRRQTPTLICLYKIKALDQLPRGLQTLLRYDSASAQQHGLNHMSFSDGKSGHYFLLSEQDGRSLMWRMGDPGKFNPQIVGVYNYVTIVAFVVTDQLQALDPAAFQLLLDTIKTDLQNVDLPMPKFLLR